MNETIGPAENKAEILYGEKRQAALDSLDEIRRLICEKSDANQNQTPTHYTHAGSMEYVAYQLGDVIQFLSRS